MAFKLSESVTVNGSNIDETRKGNWVKFNVRFIASSAHVSSAFQFLPHRVRSSGVIGSTVPRILRFGWSTHWFSHTTLPVSLFQSLAEWGPEMEVSTVLNLLFQSISPGTATLHLQDQSFRRGANYYRVQILCGTGSISRIAVHSSINLLLFSVVATRFGPLVMIRLFYIHKINMIKNCI
jgi:hypothetical protein